jgi:hypothetical protein
VLNPEKRFAGGMFHTFETNSIPENGPDLLLFSFGAETVAFFPSLIGSKRLYAAFNYMRMAIG